MGMMLNLEKLRRDLQERFDKLGMTVIELSDKSGLNRSSVYRILSGDGKKIRRNEAIKLAEALGLEWEISGEEMRTRVRGQSPVNPRRENIIKGIVEMLKEIDYQTLECAEEITRILTAMQVINVIEVTNLIKRLSDYEDSDMLREKLKAFAVLVLPYEERDIKRMHSDRSVSLSHSEE